jgi:tripartite-type tricarboxylate transporter receptor subunit TctC
MKSFVRFCIIAFALTVATGAKAWTPPSTVKVIVGQSPGGGNEFAFRGILPVLEKNNPGINFRFDHKPGLDNVVAMNHFANQPQDGSAILVVVQASGFVTAPTAYKKQLKTDPMNYTFVTTLAKSPMAFVVKENSRFRTVPQLTEYLKTPGTKFNVGISGGINLLAYSYFTNSLGISQELVQKINYKSPTEATVAVASGQIDMAIVPMSVPKPLIDAGKVRIIAHTGSSAVVGQESVPLMRDYIPNFVLDTSWTVFLPPGTQQNIVDWYVKNTLQAQNDPTVKGYYRNNWATIDPKTLGPSGTSRSIQALKAQWMPIAQKIIEEEK